MRTALRVATACAVLGGAALPAQTEDPAELLKLQRVLQTAMAGVAPSIVKVETFGGTRKMLAPDLANADGMRGGDKPTPMPQGYRPKDLDELFDKIPIDRLKEMWKEHGLDPQELDDLDEAQRPLQIKKLRTFGTEELQKLFEDHGIEPSRPAPEPPTPDQPKAPEKPKKPQLVMPGFLQAQGATAGIVMSPDGWILVSRFALNFNPTTILVTLPDGRSFNALRGGEDTSRGIALCKIDAQDLQVPEFVDPAEVSVGQWAFALGRTFGSDQPSVHMGIVSATDRLFGRALQIDAYTSPANYGGPVIDVRGHVLGVSVPLSPSGRDVGVDWYDSGIGFATTVADIGELIQRMKDGQVLHRGWLGVATDPTFNGPGARLVNVVAESPAKGVDLRKGDEIVAIDGVDVRNNFHLQMLVSSKMAGDPVHLEYLRDDGPRHGVTVFLSDVPIKEREARTKKEETFTLPWEEGDPQEKK